MTAFDLLRQIGNVDDKYIMESRKRPKKKPVWPTALAAILALAILGSGAKFLIGLRDNTLQDSAAATSAAAEEAPIPEAALPEEAEEAPAEEAPAAQEIAEEEAAGASLSAYDVTLLAGAKYPQSIAYDDYEARSERWTSNQVTAETTYAMNAFSYRTAAAILRGQETSGCYSPLSLYHTLSILASGADGETRNQLLSLLGVSDVETLSEENGKLYRVNYTDNDVNILKIANALWLDETAEDGTPVTYDQDWVLSVAADYYADVYTAEFSGEDTEKAMGAWIAEQTGGMLQPSLDLSDSTVMALVNTLWYKSQWTEQFQEKNNTTDSFTTAAGQTVTTEFMHRTDASGSYVQADGYLKSYLRMDQGKMIIVLPEEGTDIDTLLTEEALWEIFENADYQSAQVVWSVPKFETNTSYDLIRPLQQLGVTDAFDLISANFSNMTTDSLPLYLGLLRQDTHIALSENGVEAAAFSLAGMEAGVSEPDETIIEMNLNRPFLYLITSNDGSTLFIGVVRDPNT